VYIIYILYVRSVRYAFDEYIKILKCSSKELNNNGYLIQNKINFHLIYLFNLVQISNYFGILKLLFVHWNVTSIKLKSLKYLQSISNKRKYHNL